MLNQRPYSHQHWTDNLSPWVWRIHGNSGIRWYGLAYAVGFYAAWLIGLGMIRRGRLYISPNEWTTAIVYAAIGGVVGAHLGDVLLYRGPFRKRTIEHAKEGLGFAGT
jgi:phosphatidylglycerol:prolipoprotein diacylglycerol transferase